MQKRLWKNRVRDFWVSVPELGLWYFLKWLKKEEGELITAVTMLDVSKQLGNEPDYQAVIDECADIANYAMMIADKARELDSGPRKMVE
jgi:hypothetical protein